MTQEQPIDFSALKLSLQLACILDDLKKRIREGWIVWPVSVERLESVAEHSWGCLMLANLLYPLHPNSDKIDIAIVNEMLIWHEIGEAIIGDVPMSDKKRHDAKVEDEHRAWKQLLSQLPYGDRIYNLLIEFDAHLTPESMFAYAIDKLEALKHIKEDADSGNTHSLAWYLVHNEMLYQSESIRKQIDEGAETVVDIWFDVKDASWAKDPFFKAVRDILLEMDTNLKPPELEPPPESQ